MSALRRRTTMTRRWLLISLPRDETGVITVEMPPGTSAYDFTFG